MVKKLMPRTRAIYLWSLLVKSGQKYLKWTANLVAGKHLLGTSHSATMSIWGLQDRALLTPSFLGANTSCHYSSTCFCSWSLSHSEWQLGKLRTGIDCETLMCLMIENAKSFVPWTPPSSFPAFSMLVLTQETGRSRTTPKVMNARPEFTQLSLLWRTLSFFRSQVPLRE